MIRRLSKGVHVWGQESLRLFSHVTNRTVSMAHEACWIISLALVSICHKCTCNICCVTCRCPANVISLCHTCWSQTKVLTPCSIKSSAQEAIPTVLHIQGHGPAWDTASTTSHSICVVREIIALHWLAASCRSRDAFCKLCFLTSSILHHSLHCHGMLTWMHLQIKMRWSDLSGEQMCMLCRHSACGMYVLCTLRFMPCSHWVYCVCIQSHTIIR